MIAGAGIFSLGVWSFLQKQLIVQKECFMPYETAVREFPARAVSLRWSVRSVPCGLPSPVKGKRIAVFEICSREYAGRILAEEDSRKTAAVLPCKIAIYESQGKVWISSLNGNIISMLAGGICRDTFVRHILPEQKLMLFDLLCRERESTGKNRASR